MYILTAVANALASQFYLSITITVANIIQYIYDNLPGNIKLSNIVNIVIILMHLILDH